MLRDIHAPHASSIRPVWHGSVFVCFEFFDVAHPHTRPPPPWKTPPPPRRLTPLPPTRAAISSSHIPPPLEHHLPPTAPLPFAPAISGHLSKKGKRREKKKKVPATMDTSAEVLESHTRWRDVLLTANARSDYQRGDGRRCGTLWRRMRRFTRFSK